MNPRTKTLLTVGGVLLLLAACVGLAPYYSTILWWEVRPILPVLLAIAVFVAITVGFALVGGAMSKGASDRTAIGMAVLGCFIGAAGALLWIAHTQYDQDRTLIATMKVTGEPVPTLAGRAPYQVGQAQARPNLGDSTGDIADTTYVPGQDRYATLVARRGWLSGYEVALTQQIPLQGRGEADKKCAFDRNRADARISGNFSHNLGRKIAQQQRWVRFSDQDAYAYCDGDTPIVVVPLKRQVGILVVTEKPAGVALYNGKTGAVTITTNTSKVPGPSYPLSLAAQQRKATAGSGSFPDWVFNRAGWETPDDDTNSGNDSEFTLDAGGQPTYVTPLTGRGSATAISVVTTVPARHSGLGLAPLTVHKLNPVWVSPGAILDKIKADYQDIPNWQTFRVYEVIPTGGDSWVATLGTGQNILYRATGTGNLKGDKATCLLRADGSIYRCGTAAAVGGNGVGSQYGPTGTPGAPGSTGPAPSGDLRGMSNEEFAELQRRIAAESACRINPASCGR
ncbi:hypothetical protein [Micromonospora sp. RV43]|uniref:hypothetical protein n=1 Tax=Micromonospora sp. RV43 TaxID=1661387 RepID=UPI00064C092D|nr:hypothetical protein [Micromonospora sp. RV43]